MRSAHVLVIVVLFSFSTLSGFAQVGINATLSGTVSDATGALIPGVEVTARNTGTGVASTMVTNESGTDRFASLQPGSYEASAALPGFQAQTFRLMLGTAQQIRQNFILQVGAVTQAVEVSAAPDQLLTAASASVGNVLPSAQLVDLPLVGRNVMDLVTASMPGVRGDGNPDTTFAGITANSSANLPGPPDLTPATRAIALPTRILIHGDVHIKVWPLYVNCIGRLEGLNPLF